MKNRILCIALLMVGFMGIILILGNFMNGGPAVKSLKELFNYSIIATVLFFSGVALFPAAKKTVAASWQKI